MDTFVGRVQRGAGRVDVERLPYFGEQAAEVLAGTKHLILISSQPPITFFAYPDKPNWLTPEGCELHTLVEREGDVDGALEALADALGAPDRNATSRGGSQAATAQRRTEPSFHRRCVWAPAARERHRGGRRRHLWRRVFAFLQRSSGARLAPADRRVQSASACQRRLVPEWPARTDVSSAFRETGPACTQCRLCGRKHART